MGEGRGGGLEGVVAPAVEPRADEADRVVGRDDVPQPVRREDPKLEALFGPRIYL